jgi:enoyl-CoA hydratase/carnithine racemase
MSYETVKLEKLEPAITLLTLNRPDRLNAWNELMRDEMAQAVSEVVRDNGVRVLIVTGAGRAFSAGEDVRRMEALAEAGTKVYRRIARGVHNVFDELEAIELPVIAAINGVAAGGGLELALSCDFRIAADNARMGFPENNVGLIPGSGGCSRLVKLIGPAKAKRLVMTGEVIPAADALRLGLIDEVVPASELNDHVLAFARKLAAKAPLALGLAKVVINACVNADLETGRNLERLGQSVLKSSEDHIEGARAFVEKRPAAFKGK